VSPSHEPQALLRTPKSRTMLELEAYAKRPMMNTNERRSFVIPMSSRFRQIWNFALTVLLFYVGTALPYFVSFCQLRIGGELPSEGLEVTFWIVDIFFYIDFFLNFIFTFEDASGEEIFDNCKIAKNYLCGRMWVDLIANMPVAFWDAILSETQAEGGISKGGVYKLTRLARLQRISRLTRLASMSKWFSQRVTRHPSLSWLKGVQSVRITNFVFTLFWFVHILACGWYLCAALHLEPEETWVARRVVDSEGHVLLAAAPEVQWANSMYFVLTVFTTVGFGDISAVSTGEIVYVSFTMVVGAVIHSIIVSEIIGIVTAIDTEEKEIASRLRIVDDFSDLAGVDDDTRENIKTWLSLQAKRGNLPIKVDRELARSIFLNGNIPSELLQELPPKMFGGSLLESQIIKVVRNCAGGVSPRFVVNFALSIHPNNCLYGDFVYRVDDFAASLYIVEKGIFSYVFSTHTLDKRKEKPKTEEEKPKMENGRPENETKSKSWAFGSAEGIAGFAGSVTVVATNVANSLLNDDEGSPSPKENEWSPFKIFSKGSYFGDVELIAKKPRRYNARCEAPEGSLLCVDCQDFQMIMDTFPQFRRVWQAEAARRGRAHALALKKRRSGAKSLEETAALRIQTFWRDKVLAKQLAPQSMISARNALAFTAPMASHLEESCGDENCYRPGRCTCCGGTPGGADVAVAALRKEMRESLAELRTDMLHEIKQGFLELKSGLDSNRDLANGLGLGESFC